MGNAFNRAAPQNGSVWVATYDQDAARYLRTVIVGSGPPAVNGRFNDKTAIEADRGVASPYVGNVYAAWSLFQGVGGNNSIQFTRSTDHGATFSHAAKISTGSKDVQFAGHRGDQRRHRLRGLPAVRKQPRPPAERDPLRRVTRRWRLVQQARHRRDLRAVRRRRHGRRPGRCGRGPREGLQQRRRASVRSWRGLGRGQPRLRVGALRLPKRLRLLQTRQPAADHRRPEGGRPEGLPRLRRGPSPARNEPRRPPTNTADPSGSSLRVGQGGIYFAALTGGSWSAPALLAPTARGHQLFPDINADGGVLHAVWHDSRNDPAYSVQYPAGNDGSRRDAAGFAAATKGLDTYGASSRTGGASWSVARVSTVSQMPNFEMFGDRQVPFHGDYNYVSSVGAFAYNVWTDTRQVVPGDDPRNPGGEGFDVLQCRTLSAGSYGADTCPNAGGLDQDIVGRATTG